MRMKLRYIWCCISPNGHVISDNEETFLTRTNPIKTTCERCNCPVKVWMDTDCKDDWYWIQEV